MGQVVLLVVAAVWAAVLLPPLLRSRLENRPNSSVLDFRNQLSSLQRVVPTRGVGVRSMSRSLAPSMLNRSPATGRPDTRNGARVNGVVSSRMAPPAPATRPTRRDARMHEATLRPRQHGAAAADPRLAAQLAGTRAAEARRRRANVLFLLVLTTVCAGFLAATTDSKAMVYLFAASMVALGGFVYLLVTLNQQHLGARQPQVAQAATPRRRSHGDGREALDGRGDDGWVTGDRSRRRSRAHRYVDEVDEVDEELWESPPAPRQERQVAPTPAVRYASESQGPPPGSGESGLISYGLGTSTRQGARRDPRDPYGRESYGWEATREITRRTPARNGRHATGQVPVQRRPTGSPVDDRYSHAG